MNIILFHRDLRISDHQPLTAAADRGEVLPLYVFEPSEWEGSILSKRHYQFVVESLAELSKQLQQRNGQLFFAQDELEAVLGVLLETYESIHVFSHADSLVLDKVTKWVKQHTQTLTTYGLEPKKGSARGFKRVYETYMAQPLIPAPEEIHSPSHVPEILFTDLKKLKTMNSKGSKIRFGQQGGELQAVETLDTFLDQRYLSYMENLQNPLASSQSSSRLSAFIVWGNISVRTIFQKTTQKLDMIECDKERLQLEQFLSGLYTRVKICSLPQAEVTGDSKIERIWNDEWYLRWLEGKTGIPIIDASMRCLYKTGWLNFTLRGLVISFVSNILLLDSEKPSAKLAGLYLDYEPAIHDFYYQQISGLKGWPKIQNPVKLGRQLDPDGSFIRRYIPELDGISSKYIHEPWLYPGFYKLGYEAPMVDVIKAMKNARIQSKEMKNTTASREKKKGEAEQLSFDL
ncbi:FAD-binding domain-containing protein [Mesobacillus subterraneus]|uniref:Deoxyribodipyrimidine photo-lyase n=1 Tax=Mesobacillus subterraneus TaxID=285983 RepID=A0A3R9KU04_9BACI|nr:FAD-binding domain-containing protein [Mesobacillus subterraneus]RSD26129.1 deoxyribodipyrimidine photo-lyase [Mesobacillus subterraneus]